MVINKWETLVILVSKSRVKVVSLIRSFDIGNASQVSSLPSI